MTTKKRGTLKSSLPSSPDAPIKVTAYFHPADVWEGRVNQNDVPASERPCYAHGCPLLGTITDSVLAGPSARWFCRYHSAAQAEQWGEITRKIRMGGHRSEAVAIDKPAYPEKPEGMTSQEWARHWCGEIAKILATPPATGRDWARKLKAREEAGEDLAPLQRSMWREALLRERENVPESEGEIEARRERAAIQGERKAL